MPHSLFESGDNDLKSLSDYLYTKHRLVAQAIKHYKIDDARSTFMSVSEMQITI
jgi:hypothetical protein